MQEINVEFVQSGYREIKVRQIIEIEVEMIQELDIERFFN